jgi:hypothetical protein
MAVGHQPDADELNRYLAADAQGLRNAAQEILKRWSLVKDLGEAGLQAPPYDMTPEDAAAFFEAANRMQTVAAVYYGELAQPDPFNFDDALSEVRGGQ